MRRSAVLCTLLLVGLPLLTVSPDTVDVRMEDEHIVWRIDRNRKDTRMACTGSLRDMTIDSPGFTFRWKGVDAGRLRRAGILREIAAPFSLSVSSEGFFEESGYKADFSLDPVKGWGAAFRVPLRFSPEAAGLGMMVYAEYSCFWLICPTCIGGTLFEPFTAVSLKRDGIEDELDSDYPFQLHTDPLFFTGVHFRAAEGGCSLDLLYSRAESAVGVPGQFLRYHIELGRDDREGFKCRLLARKSSAAYPAIGGSHVPEEAELQIRGDYGHTVWRCFAGGGLLRKKEAPVPKLCLETGRSLSGGFRIDGEQWTCSCTTEYDIECSCNGENTAHREHTGLIKYSRYDWWMELSLSISREGSARSAVYADGEFGIRRQPFVMRVRGDSTGHYSLRFDYSFRPKNREKTAGFLCIHVDAGENAYKTVVCSSIAVGLSVKTQ